jgi:cadmium resistance protein CadD (predicted permease)
VTHLLAIIAVAAGVYTSSNIDDLVVLTVLFLAARTGSPRPWQIITGQYLGFGAIILASAGIAGGLVFVPDRWIGLAGAVPLAIGIWALVRTIRGHGEPKQLIVANGVLAVAGIAIAAGADDIGVYPPLLRTLSPLDALTTLVVMFVGVAVWCLLAWRLGTHKRVVALLGRVETWLVPAVFILVGAVILSRV